MTEKSVLNGNAKKPVATDYSPNKDSALINGKQNGVMGDNRGIGKGDTCDKAAHGTGTVESGGESSGRNKSLREEFRVNKKLLPIKLATFCFHGGSFAFLPYITLHMKQVGLTNEEIALIYAILPVSSILGPLIGGIVADKLRAFRAVFLTNVICMAVLHTLLLTVPHAPRPSWVSFTCDGSGGVTALQPWLHSSCGVTTQDGSQAPAGGELLQGGGAQGNLLTGAVNLPTALWTDSNISFTSCRYQCEGTQSTIAIWCLGRGNVTTCSEKTVQEQFKIIAHMSVPNPALLNSSQCSLPSVPKLTNFTVEGTSYDSLSCPNTCPLTCDITGLPDAANHVTTSEYSSTFWIYLALRVPAQFFLAAAFTMMDAVTMAVIANLGGDFGKQRLMSMLSLAVMPLMSSLVVHNTQKTEDGTPDYAAVFYFGDALLLVAVSVMAYIKLERPESPPRNVLKELRDLMVRPRVIIFMVVILVLGSNWGFLESFFFVYLSQMNAPTYLLGLTLTFGCVIGIPFMFLADRIIERVGRTNIFILSFLAYSVRMFGYSFITNPWLSFPFEALEVITYQLMWVAAVTYFPVLAPATLLATMSGLAGTVHYNVGRGVGALMGGYLMDAVGSVNTFRVFGGLSLVGGIIYALLVYTCLGAMFRGKESEGKDDVELKSPNAEDKSPNTAVGKSQ